MTLRDSHRASYLKAPDLPVSCWALLAAPVSLRSSSGLQQASVSTHSTISGYDSNSPAQESPRKQGSYRQDAATHTTSCAASCTHPRVVFAEK